jgi:dCMP deaminase
MKRKFIGKYMRLAKQVGEDKNPCYSRKIGVVIVRAYDDGSGRVLGTGYNGPPRGTPHCDDLDYLEQIFWPQLDPVEKAKAINAARTREADPNNPPNFYYDGGTDDAAQCKFVCGQYAGSKICPRKIIGAPSGKRLELCSCAHAETNAIVNSTDDLHGAYMFCWCGVPCVECTKLTINAGIKKVYTIDWGADYSVGSRWLFEQAGVEVICLPPEYYLSEDEE